MFNIFGKKNTDNKVENVNVSVQVPEVNPITVPAGATSAKISLKKSSETLDKAIVDLTKRTGVDLSKHIARVVVVLDISGSMDWQYSNGAVQNVLNRILPIALRFDDDGQLEVYLFNNSVKQIESMNIDNFENYVNKVILSNTSIWGGTSYAPAIKMVSDDYNDGSPYPAFCIFITDGENGDRSEADKALKKAKKIGSTYFQFVGIGNERFNYLQGINQPNASFIKVADFSKLDDNELYTKLLSNYPTWVKNRK